jgi:hypothetical protein
VAVRYTPPPDLSSQQLSIAIPTPPFAATVASSRALCANICRVPFTTTTTCTTTAMRWRLIMTHMYYIERAATQRTVESVHAAWKDQTDREEVCVCWGSSGGGAGPRVPLCPRCSLPPAQPAHPPAAATPPGSAWAAAAPAPLPPLTPPPPRPPPIGAPCTHCLRHGDPMHAQK